MRKEERRQLKEAIELLENPRYIVEYLSDSLNFKTENIYIKKLTDVIKTQYNEDWAMAITLTKWFKDNLVFLLNYRPNAITPNPY